MIGIQEETHPSILKAASWLLTSGIQDLTDRDHLKGGVASWYDIDQDLYPYLYSEITGYAITCYLFLNHIHPDPIWVDRATLAAEWLIHNALDKSGGVKCRFYLNPKVESSVYSFERGRMYTFDTAMVGYGLLQLYKVKPDLRWLRCIESIYGFLSSTVKKTDAAYYPFYNSRTQKCEESFDKWSNQSGSFHSKLALFFIDYYWLKKEEHIRKEVFSLLDSIARQQLDSGRFITDVSDGSTHHHPHSYTVEGLLYSGIYLDRKDYIEVAYHGAEWLFEAFFNNDFMPSLYTPEGFVKEERIDVVAQTLRIGSILFGIRRWPGVRKRLDSLKNRLLSFQYHGSEKQKGGFYFRLPRTEKQKDSFMGRHLNAWVSMFALQALWMHEEFVFREKEIRLDQFI